MKLLLTLLLTFPIAAMENPEQHPLKHSHHVHNHDLEKAMHDIAQLKKNKPCCRLTKARVAALTTLGTAAITATITITTLYSRCNLPPAS